MLQRILNFWATIETVLDMCRHLFFDQLRARTELFFEDLDEWLAQHHLTLPQIAANFLGVAFGLMALGVAVDLVGLCVGQWINENAARGIIVVGTLICFSGFCQLLVLRSMAKGLYDLVIRGGEAALAILNGEGVNLPDRIRRQLQAMRNRRNMTSTMQSLYVAYAAVTVSFLCWPSFYGFYGIVVAGVAVSGIVVLRNINCVKGYGIVRLMLSGCYGFAGGNIVFLVFYAIGRPLLLWGWQGAVTNQNALRFSLVAGSVAALITFLVQLLTMRLGKEETDLRQGETEIERFRLRVAEVDATTGKPTKFQKVETREAVDFSIVSDWGTSPKLWFFLVVIAWAVWTFVFGKPNPLASIEWGYQNLLILAVIFVIAAWLFGGRTEVVEIEEVPQPTPQPAAQPLQHGH
jgi:hypothetical protein